MDSVILTENLVKHFGKVHAVNGISLHVGKGEIYGFLGLNGAGKTTTIRMLLGMIRPTSGSCRLNGRRVNPGARGLWNQVGYMVEIPYAYPELTVRENLEIIRRLRFLPATAVGEVIGRMKLGPYRDRKARHLSQGNAQRLGIAKAIMHDPPILLLDEPANGLDPAGIVEIREMLLDMASNRGTTIFISSHILGEISRFASRIGIIHEGVLIQESDIHELERLRRRSLHAGTSDNPAAAGILREKGYTVKIAGKDLMEVSGNRAIENPAGVATLLVGAGYPPSLLKVEEEDLESYFLRIIGMKGEEA